MASSPFKDRPHLQVFLPLLHVAWSDTILTPSEIENLSILLDDQDWLDESDKHLLKEYLDPQKPPTPKELKGWLSHIKRLSEKLPEDWRGSLFEMGVQSSLLNKYTDDSVLEKVRFSLENIETAVGLGPTRSINNLIKKPKTSATKATSLPSFDSKAMATILDGNLKPTVEAVKTLIADPKFQYTDENDLTEYREKVLEWCKACADEGFGSMAYPKSVGGQEDMARYFMIMEILSYHDLSLVIKFGVQFGLFGMSVYLLGTEKHHQKYLHDIGTLNLPGSFAMTETGHGSNVQGLETTATFDKKNNGFVIHTPNDHARKDYIGNAALHARKATVFAKLIIDGVDYGVNAFVVPLRSETGQVLQGIRIEDCGRKMGLNGVDNGRIWFDEVFIPKENMLNRFADVTDEGEFTSPISSDGRRFFTMLGTLVGGRIGVPRAGLSAAKSGLAIAIKYGAGRKQFGPAEAAEYPILDYQTHQRRLMPLLANAYAFHFGLQYVTDRFLKRTDDDMQEVEALAAGLKAMATWNTTHTLQECREACGGQGYLYENRLSRLKNDTDVFTTFEGDNTVLLQLVAKSRLTEFKQEFHDINMLGIISYVTSQAKTMLTEMNPVITRSTDEVHLLDQEFQLNAFRYRERDILTSAARRLKKHLDEGMDSFDAFNVCQSHLVNVGKAYVERIVLEQFIQKVNSVENKQLSKVLKLLCDLFALTQIEHNKGWYLEHGYMEGVKTKAIRKLVNKLCVEVRKDALPLVDAFEIPESCLAAPIAFQRSEM